MREKPPVARSSRPRRPLDADARCLVSGRADWRDQALCVETGPDAFFPEKGGSTREAKRLCTACTVRPECLDFALHNDHRFGI